MLNIHTETIRLIRDRERGKFQALVYDILISFKVEEGAGKRCSECGRGGWWCDGDIICLSLHGCHHQNDVCIKMGSDAESHFNVSLTVRDNLKSLVTRQCPQTTTF